MGDLIEFNIIHTLIFSLGLVILSLIAFGISFFLEIRPSIDLSKNILIGGLCILGISIIVFFYRNYHIFKQHMITCGIYIGVIFIYSIGLYNYISIADFPESIFGIFMIYSGDAIFGWTIQAILLGIYVISINTIYFQRFYQKNLESEISFVAEQPSLDISDVEVINSLFGKNTSKISNGIIYILTIISFLIIPIFYASFGNLPRTLGDILFYSMFLFPVLFSLSFWRFSRSLGKTQGDIFMYSSTILILILFFFVWSLPADAGGLQHVILVFLTPIMILMSIGRFIIGRKKKPFSEI